ncbi:phosphodiester glycosidase family protein [Fischerella sp. PCC 9605]|uniref:phosphodiester glycosidase family protein n=1 Tax=Fischerella sp. PCC 9605 TaxID=1173024 RepID=UPI00047DF757|nr:phosphodiester glycosidase family protein [Fischerella sp. PCC 9605]
MASSKICRWSFLFLAGALLVQELTLVQPTAAKTVQVNKGKINGVSFHRVIVDLTDFNTFITIGLANNARVANSARRSNGDEEFNKMMARHDAAVVVNGTFFAKNRRKSVMGNMVAGGRFLKYSRWENYGTTLGLRVGNKPEMVTARVDGKPKWREHWFSITSGPRLLRRGKIWLKPRREGFKDPHVLGTAKRTAIGFPASGKKLIIVSFNQKLTLEQMARAMRALGCYEAMNLDGGTSRALAVRGKILVRARRPLTNVIVVYDAKHPAPAALRRSWIRFQKRKRALHRTR